jgi:hypothetical protein
MSRFNRQGILDSINVQLVQDLATLALTKLPSGQSLTMPQIRDGVVDILTYQSQVIGEAFRHLYDVTNAEAVMYQLNGDNPDGQYTMSLLEEGDVGGLNVGGVETGYQLLPIVTGAPVTAGFLAPSDPFDGESEIDVGDIPNTLKIRHDGQITISSSCLPEVASGQNKQIECDIAVFDDQGVPTSVLGFRTSVNNTTGGRGNSATVPSFTIQNETIIPAGANIGLVIRKNVAEGTVDVVMKRSFVLVNFNSLART